MNDDRDFERDVAAVLKETAPGRGSDDLFDDITMATREMKPWPRWRAVISEPPMRVSSGLAVGSPTTRVFALLVTLLLFAVVLVGAAVAGSRLLATSSLLVVAADGSGDFSTITEAVGSSDDGDTILVEAGTYREHVTITHDITLRGDGDRDSIVIAFPADSPTSRFTGNGLDEMILPTGLILRASDARIEDVTIASPAVGLAVLVSGGRPTLEGVRITFEDGLPDDPDANTPPRVALVLTDGSEPTVRDSRWNGYVAVRGGASPTFSGNVIMVDSVSLEGPGEMSIVGNEFDGARLTVAEHATGLIEDNDFDGAGLKVHTGADLIVRGNSIRDADAAGDPGILVAHEGTTATLDHNVVSDSQMGILISTGAEVTLTGNTVCNNAENLSLLAAPEPVLEGDNEICDDGAVR